MTFWVLRERSTQRLMPRKPCQTRVEFGDAGAPRLFTSKNAASQALSCWRMGLWCLTGDEDGVWPEPSSWKGNVDIADRRRATEVDIVEYDLVECPS